MHPLLEAEFEDLLGLWRRHDDLRRQGAPIGVLGESRRRLDRARDRIGELRRALAPTPAERGDAAVAVMCEALGVPVTISWQSVTRIADRLSFTCVCGAAAGAAAPLSPARGVGRR